MNNRNKQAVAGLVEEWRAGGIVNGDVVLLHSSTNRLLRRMLRNGVRLTANNVLASFQQAVGERGTLVLPLFNFDFADGIAFDIRSTRSKMGVVTEAARVVPGAVRTGHPMYSFAALGEQAHMFRNLTNVSGYGNDSPFALLLELGGKIGVLDLSDQDSMTFYHHVEEMHDVPYRYHKVFEGPYTGWDGIEQRRRFSVFVRDLDRGVETDVNPMGEKLWDLGLYHGRRPREGSGLRTINAHALYDAVSDAIRSDSAEGLLYRISKTCQGRTE